MYFHRFPHYYLLVGGIFKRPLSSAAKHQLKMKKTTLVNEIETNVNICYESVHGLVTDNTGPSFLDEQKAAGFHQINVTIREAAPHLCFLNHSFKPFVVFNMLLATGSHVARTKRCFSFGWVSWNLSFFDKLFKIEQPSLLHTYFK